MKKLAILLGFWVLFAMSVPADVFAEAAKTTGKTASVKTSKSKKKTTSKKSTSHKKKSSKKKTDKNKAEEEKPTRDSRSLEEKMAEQRTKFRMTGVRSWYELSEEQEAEEVEKQKAQLEEIKKSFPRNNMIYYESAHFLYLTDAPKPIAVECLKFLEAGYEKLIQIFNLPKESPVWQGKGIVIAFARKQDFLEFESTVYQTNYDFEKILGLAHLSSDGSVVISMFYGDVTHMDSRWQFISTMIHETTHGFVHRYKSATYPPTWLNEGIADFVAGVAVPLSKNVPNKLREAMQVMRQTGSVGGLMEADGQIMPWQYGTACGLVGFMIQSDPKAFKKFFEAVKSGQNWQMALAEQYKCSVEQLLMAFGRANGIPRLGR